MKSWKLEPISVGNEWGMAKAMYVGSVGIDMSLVRLHMI